ncbi:MAG: hypothetical protein C0508_03910 [Cyanobacteria bacterium PR.023]|jgi:hypothetical protein|nr:hypothetical protein [Cyanobacteria bacterium PR.023]MDQ5933927.1 hypothetical protein [Cyanobacteriota bacterium erpe_2018_sw_21hr_WHONDRS-SW48-000092_B_bin.40]
MAISIAIIYLLILLLVFYFWLIGLWRAFKAHPLLGLLFLMLQAPLTITGAIYVLFKYDIAAEIVKLFD